MGQKQSGTGSVMRKASKDGKEDTTPMLADSEVGRKRYDSKGGYTYGGVGSMYIMVRRKRNLVSARKKKENKFVVVICRN